MWKSLICCLGGIFLGLVVWIYLFDGVNFLAFLVITLMYIATIYLTFQIIDDWCSGTGKQNVYLEELEKARQERQKDLEREQEWIKKIVLNSGVPPQAEKEEPKKPKYRSLDDEWET